MASVDTGQVAQMFLRHRLTREQLVEALATMTACRQHHAVHALDSQPVDELVSSLARHLGRFGVEGRPTFPRTDEATWAKIATDNGVSADQWPMILDLAKTRRTLHPEQTRGFADDFELAAVLVSQRGDPSRPVSTTPFADKTTWPTRAENPAWHRSLTQGHRNV